MNIINKRLTGSEKESLAVSYLESCGYTILERNFRSRSSEIDIVARTEDTVVFIEVKYRSSTEYGFPEEAVNQKKQHLIRNAAMYYMCKNNLSVDLPYRFDVIVILGEDITHIKDAF